MVLWWKPTFGAICSLGQIHHYDKYLVSDIQGIYQKKHFQSFKFALIIHYDILHISVIFVGNLESWIPKWYPINTYSRTFVFVRACVCVCVWVWLFNLLPLLFFGEGLGHGLQVTSIYILFIYICIFIYMHLVKLT